ncbi:MAG: hypothetical protein Q7S12_03870 [bacterium]|nr:hypothetical protein [bacterium]
MIHFTRHAIEKFEVLKRHGVLVINDIVVITFYPARKNKYEKQ